MFPAPETLITEAGDVSITGVFKESLKYKGPFFTGDFDTAMKSAFELNITGRRKSTAPILIVHGTEDKVVDPELTKALLPLALNIGDTFKVSWYQDEDHRSVISAGQNEILEWFDNRLKGLPALKENSSK